MRDELTAADNERHLADGISRGVFGAGAVATGIAAMLPTPCRLEVAMSGS